MSDFGIDFEAVENAQTKIGERLATIERNCLAAMAMQGLCANSAVMNVLYIRGAESPRVVTSLAFDELSQIAFGIADAMKAESKQGSGGQ